MSLDATSPAESRLRGQNSCDVSAGSHRDDDYRRRRRHADAAILADALFLVVCDHAVRYRDVHHCLEGQE